MKKILMSVFAIVAVAAAAGIGSWALWSDSESSNGNTVTADKMDLKLSVDGEEWVDDNDLLAGGIIPLSVENTYPGDTKTADVYVKNESNSVSGELKISVANVSSREVSLEEPEKDSGDNWDEHTFGNGELCDNITVDVKYQGATIATNALLTGNWLKNGMLIDGTMNPGEEGKLEFVYHVKTNAGNEIMTDNCIFDLKANLEQI